MIRQKEIEALKEILSENKNNDIRIARGFLEDVIHYFESQPKIGGWIPCSEKLPKYGQRYLVSVIWEDGNSEAIRVYDAVYGSDGNWHSHDYEIMTCKVIAWQPLPKPYQS